LPIDELKIDKSFIQALGCDRRARAIVSSAIELARALDLTLVAEGIETSANLKILEEIGADIGQGWFIAQPLSSIQLDKFLTASGAMDHITPLLVGTVGG
jgi:EAL domain-containing protein (putative c-di-GMP-specific phosphodiesterase class I)